MNMSIFMLTKSAAELARVKAGMDSESQLPWEHIWWFFACLALVVAVASLFNIVRHRRYSRMLKGWTAINDANRIAAVFKRAAARQADCTMEIFDQQHSLVYRCRVAEVRAGYVIMLELARMPGTGLEFEGFPVQVHMNFRPTPKEEMEHYQFSSRTIGLSYEREKSWQVPLVSVSWPNTIISAQRRDFLRIEPGADHAMVMRFQALAGDIPQVLEINDTVQIEASVLDISIGGVQVLFSGVASINEQLRYLLTIDLPMNGLDIELKSNRLYIVFQPLSRDVLGLSADNSASRRTGQNIRTIVRGTFVGRYRLQADTGQWSYVEFSVESFQDLSHWLHAYQRFMLKKEKDLLSVPLRPPLPRQEQEIDSESEN